METLSEKAKEARNSPESLDNEREKDTNLQELSPAFEYEKFGIGVEEIKTEVEQLIKQGNEANENKGLFLVKTANCWIEQAKTRPIPQMLFSELWYQGELCILFSHTNLGKRYYTLILNFPINSLKQGIQKTLNNITPLTKIF